MRVLRVRFLALALGEKYVRDEIFAGNAYLSDPDLHGKYPIVRAAIFFLRNSP